MSFTAPRSTLRHLAQRGLLLAAAALMAVAAKAHGPSPHTASAAVPGSRLPPLPPLPAASEESIVAEVDGKRIGRNALALLLRYQLMDRRGTDARQLLDDVIEQRVLARHAASRYSEAELFPAQRVAFTPSASADEKLAGVLRTVYRERLQEALIAEAGANMEKAIVALPAVDAAQLRGVFGDPARLRVEYRLEPAEKQAAEALVVLRYRLPGGSEGSLNLADIYARQNVQGRISLHRLDSAFLAEQARTRLAELLVVDWAAREAGRAAVDELRRNLLDREYARALSEHYGLGTDMHAPSAYLATLRQRVSQAQVNRWYDSHKEQFRHLQRVRARHIRLADEASAARVSALLARDGSNFAELARRHSIAPDAAGGGELGWLSRKPEADWQGELAFAQPPGRNGGAVREPVAADIPAQWEIVRVDEQQFGYFPKDSETVRYLAAQAIAVEQARAEFAALKQRLLREARIRRSDAKAEKRS